MNNTIVNQPVIKMYKETNFNNHSYIHNYQYYYHHSFLLFLENHLWGQCSYIWRHHEFCEQRLITCKYICYLINLNIKVRLRANMFLLLALTYVVKLYKRCAQCNLTSHMNSWTRISISQDICSPETEVHSTVHFA